MFGRTRKTEKDDMSISVLNELIYPLIIFAVLLSNAVTLTITGVILKEEKETSNIYLMLPLICTVTLNILRLETKIIRLSLFFLSLGYFLYDLFVFMYCKNIITNTMYLFISSIQMFCAVLSYV